MAKRTMSHAVFNSTIVIKRDESKSSWSSSLLVHHQSCIENGSELLKVFLELFLDNILPDSSNEYFRRAILFVTRNCTFWINL